MPQTLQNVLNSLEVSKTSKTVANRRKLRYTIELIRDIGYWNSLRTIVRLLDPVIKALRELEADNVFVSGVYEWFRWLRYHSAYGVTSPEEEKPEAAIMESEDSESEQEVLGQAQNGIELISDTAELISSSASTLPVDQSGPAEPGGLQAGTEYEKIAALPLNQLQTFFRERIQKRWKYVHTNTMGIEFMLDPAMNLNDFVGSDDENIDDEVCKLAERCGLTTDTSVATLMAEILKYKRLKHSGGEILRRKYSEASPRDYWGAKSEKDHPILKKTTEIVFFNSDIVRSK